MRISIVLPGSGREPSGGFRIVYEHANRLVEKGHSVHLIHAISLDPISTIIRTPRLFARYAKDLWVAGRSRRRWFALDKRVRVSLCLRPTRSIVGKNDVVMATGWQTAFFVNALPASAGAKAYFVQSYETWDGPEDQVNQTWVMPLRKLVIAKWLRDLADEFGEDSDLVINAIDHDFFRLVVPIDQRPARTVLFQSMARPLKGSADAVAALNRLRAAGSAFEIICFGRVDPKTFGLEPPYRFVHDPSQEQLRGLYGEATLYLNPSHIEGWGLTIAEAAASGAALVVSDIGGHRELARDGANCLTFSPHDIDGMATQVQALLDDPELRMRLAQQARLDVRYFDWTEASRQMVEALQRLVSARVPD